MQDLIYLQEKFFLIYPEYQKSAGYVVFITKIDIKNSLVLYFIVKI